MVVRSAPQNKDSEMHSMKCSGLAGQAVSEQETIAPEPRGKVRRGMSLLMGRVSKYTKSPGLSLHADRGEGPGTTVHILWGGSSQTQEVLHIVVSLVIPGTKRRHPRP